MREQHGLPTARELLTGWALLMALTVGTMIAGRVTDTGALGLSWLIALLIITWAKARTILMVYLNLRAASIGWRAGFAAMLIVPLALIAAIYALAALDILARD